MAAWKVPQMWTGRTVFIIGGGPSATDEDLTRIQNRETIAANHAFRFGNWIDILICCDYRRWDEMKYDLVHWPNLIVVGGDKSYKYQIPTNMPRGKPLFIDNFKRGWSDSPNKIARNRNTGAAGINLAYLLGATKIVLIGFDMKSRNGSANWHNVTRLDPSIGIRERMYKVHLEHLYLAANSYKDRGFEIYNTSQDSAIDDNIIPNITLNEFLDREASNGL